VLDEGYMMGFWRCPYDSPTQDSKRRRMNKEYFVKLAEEACNRLESGEESHFFKILEHVLIQKIPPNKMIPFAEIVGKRGLKNPGLYFGIIDILFNKSVDYGYRADLYDPQKSRTSEEEAKKSRVYGYRAGMIGAVFNEMSMGKHEEVVKKTKQYIIGYDHLNSSNKFAERTFHNMFVEKFSWIMGVLKEWAKDENKWIRSAAVCALHSSIGKKILNENQFKEALEIVDLVMLDNSKEVKKKAGLALRASAKHFPDETYEFVRKWSGNKNKNSVWIIKNALRYLPDHKKDELLKMIGNHS
jgi:3-methyladenine DNA glycosylase AlkC